MTMTFSSIGAVPYSRLEPELLNQLWKGGRVERSKQQADARNAPTSTLKWWMAGDGSVWKSTPSPDGSATQEHTAPPALQNQLSFLWLSGGGPVGIAQSTFLYWGFGASRCRCFGAASGAAPFKDARNIVAGVSELSPAEPS